LTTIAAGWPRTASRSAVPWAGPAPRRDPRGRPRCRPSGAAGRL